MKYIYHIAGIRILCDIPFEIIIQKESEEFLYSCNEKIETLETDIKFEMKSVDHLPHIEEDGYWKNNQYFVNLNDKQRMYLRLSPEKEPFVMVDYKINSAYLSCYYLQGFEKEVCYSHNLCDLINLETIMLYQKGILLHASFIKWKEVGILFSAPSGTGKSTQANLWEKYEGAEILNGDRAGIRMANGKWTAYGLSYAGSSGIYKNESVPIKAIIVLNQAEENTISSLKMSESFCRLYPEISIHHWDKNFVKQASDLALQILKDIPVYLLNCKPDQGAIQLVKEVLEQQEGGY